MIRIISFFLIFALLLAFIILNLDNKCAVNFGFTAPIPDVPIYITVFISIFFGMLCSLPLFHTKKKDGEKPQSGKKDRKGKKEPEKVDELPAEHAAYGIN